MHPLLLFTTVFFSYTMHHVVSVRPPPNASGEIPEAAVCSRKCNDSFTGNEEDRFKLYHCSCSKSCKIYGDCCKDSEHRIEKRPNNEYLCMYVDGRGPVQAVSGCRPGRPSEFCKSAVSHLSPVTSRVTNTTYANVFCAQCNDDDQNIVTWNVELRCCPEPNKENMLFANGTSVFLRKKYLYSTHSAGFDCPCKYQVHFGDYKLIDSLELRFCESQRKFSQCPPSWSGSETEKQCWSYEDPVYIGRNVFRNLHCAMCNYRFLDNFQCIPSSVQLLMDLGYNESGIMYICNKQGIENCIQYINGVYGRKPFMPSDMLRTRPISTRTCVPPEGQRCCSGEEYDFRSKRCRRTRRL